mgnify:CR=1 FL=1
MNVDVTQPDSIYLILDQDSISCFGLSNGIAFPDSISGGNGGFSYSWDLFAILQNSNNATNDTAVGLSAGTYTVEVTDQNNCSVTENIQVKEPNALTIDSIYQDSVTCYGLGDGIATVSNVSGGTGFGYNFTWTDTLGLNLSQDSSTAINLLAGFYNVKVTDSDACYIDTNIRVLEPNLLVLDTSAQDSVSCNGTNDGSAYVSASGGNGIYDYLWIDES